MKLLRYVPLLLISAVCACTSVSNSTRISYPLSADQYNGFLSNYTPRPTFITLENMSDGEAVLAVEMTQYGNINPSIVSPNFQFRMLKSAIPQYIALLDKYDAWRSQALNRGDAITKTIGRAPTWGQTSGVELEFTFHSGNARSHFLVIASCAIGTCVENQALVFDTTNVIRLRSILETAKGFRGFRVRLDLSINPLPSTRPFAMRRAQGGGTLAQTPPARHTDALAPHAAALCAATTFSASLPDSSARWSNATSKVPTPCVSERRSMMRPCISAIGICASTVSQPFQPARAS